MNNHYAKFIAPDKDWKQLGIYPHLFGLLGYFKLAISSFCIGVEQISYVTGPSFSRFFCQLLVSYSESPSAILLSSSETAISDLFRKSNIYQIIFDSLNHQCSIKVELR